MARTEPHRLRERELENLDVWRMVWKAAWIVVFAIWVLQEFASTGKAGTFGEMIKVAALVGWVGWAHVHRRMKGVRATLEEMQTKPPEPKLELPYPSIK